MAKRSHVDISDVMKMLRGFEKQVPFAIATALTQTAKDAQEALNRDLPYIFDRPNRFTLQGIGIQAARKANLVARIYVKDRQASYLRMQETGGERRPEPGRPINVPVNVRTDSSGNIPRNFWKGGAKQYVGARTTDIKTQKRVSKFGGGIFIANGKGATAHLTPGIYARPMMKRAAKGKSAGRVTNLGQPPTLLVAFKQAATYQPRFGFYDHVEATAKRVMVRNIERAMKKAIQTAR